MPRNGQGVYSLPPVYEAVTGETIEAQQHNVPLEDIASDLNNARPISTGGTGGQSATQARENLDVYSKTESVQAAKDAIGELEAKETPVDADSVVIVDSEDGNKPKKSLWSKVKALVNTASVGAAVAGANGKETPEDGDFFAGVGAGGSTMFKTTWGNIKAALDLRFLRLVGGTLTGQLVSLANMYIQKDVPRFLFISPSGAVEWSLQANITNTNNLGFQIKWGSVEIGSFKTDGSFTAFGLVYAGNGTAFLSGTGDINGAQWGGYLSEYLNTQIAALNATIETRSYQRTQDFLVNQVPGSLGSYGFFYYTGSGIVTPGTAIAGSQLVWSSAWGNSSTGSPPTGSYYSMGYCDAGPQTARTTLFLRRA
ncbi:hypothetical protein F9K94_17330 [Brucella tritici]|uniref:Tail fiber protein n=1 Tax=Brucella tritici TaxID=94626 RepID=A0A7V8B1W5_9HYPH|nr:hypothetical protein [Brucella tritici]KAB2656265.1 hypothetical protein F9K94_17330 [Brucella tritici]